MIPHLKGFDGAARKQKITAGSALSAGDVVVVEGRVLVCYEDIANGEDGMAYYATDEKGIQLPKATGALEVGEVVYWDENGTPVGGSTTGAITATATANIRIGRMAEAAASGDATGIVEMIADHVQQ